MLEWVVQIWVISRWSGTSGDDRPTWSGITSDEAIVTLGKSYFTCAYFWYMYYITVQRDSPPLAVSEHEPHC